MNLKTDIVSYIERTVFFCLMASGIYALAVFFYGSYFQVIFPYMNNLGEPAFSQSIRIFYNGAWPYHDLKDPPYCLVPYGPVYVWLASLTYNFFQGPFMGPRIVTVLSTVLTAVLIFLTLRKFSVKWPVAVFTAVFFISNPYIQRWNAQVNVDMTGVCFSVTTFYFLLRFIHSQFTKKRLLFLGVLAGTAAFFTKSSMIAPMGAFFLYLLANKKWRLALGYSFLQGIPVLLIYFLMNFVTRGQYYFHTTYEISQRLFFPQFIYIYWKNAGIEIMACTAATVFFIFYALRKEKFRPLYLYLLLSIIVTVSLGKQGSDTNYFLEWCAVSSIALGLVLGDLLNSEKTVFKVLRSLVFVLILIQMIVWNGGRIPWGKNKNFEERKAFYENVSKLIQKTPGKILSEDMSLLVANGKEIFYEPFPMGQMSYSGVWDNRPILDALDRKEFSLAILYFYAPALRANRTFPENFMKMFNARYHYVARAEFPGSTQQLFFYMPNES